MEASAPPSDVIETDLPCSICTYNLKGLSPIGNCPECGQAIARTYQFDLAKADPAWLGQQATTMLLLAALCFVNVSFGDSTWAMWFGYGADIVIGALNVWACRRLGRPDPADPTDQHGSVRRGVLLASIGALIMIIILGRNPSFDRSGWWIWLPIVLVAVNRFLALFLVAHFARRANDSGLGKHARLAQWTFPFTEVSSLLFLTFRLAPASFEWMMLANRVYIYLSHVVLALTLILLGRMHERLRAAIQTPPLN